VNNSKTSPAALELLLKPQPFSHCPEVDCWMTVFFMTAANRASFAVRRRQDSMNKSPVMLSGQTVSQISSSWSGTHLTKIDHQQTMIKGTERSL